MMLQINSQMVLFFSLIFAASKNTDAAELMFGVRRQNGNETQKSIKKIGERMNEVEERVYSFHNRISCVQQILEQQNLFWIEFVAQICPLAWQFNLLE